MSPVETDEMVAKSVTQYVKPIRWIASLSNGETVFEDHPPGQDAAWKRLSAYIIANGLKITRLRFQMNHLEVPLPPNAYAYVQKKKMVSMGGFSQLQYCIGHVEDNGLARIHYVSEDFSSVSDTSPDPGHPFTIYPHDGPCDRKCCDANATAK